MTTATPIKNECFGLNTLPGHIKPRYRRFALVACEDHISRLDNTDEETLVVSSNWLISQQALARNLHCIYYELGLLDWDEPDSLHADLFIRANDWVFSNGEDATRFHDVSLGKMFCGEVALCMLSHLRLTRSLIKLIERFQPDEILFFDLMSEINVLDRDLRKQSLETVAKDKGVRFTDAGNSAIPESQKISESPVDVRGDGFFKQIILEIYSRLAGLATTLRCLGRNRRDRIFMVVITNMAEPLIRQFRDQKLTPIFLARTLPKTPSLLWHCFRHGILLAARKNVPLSEADNERLIDIHGTIKKALSDPTSEVSPTIRTYVSKRILETEKLAKIAEEVLAAERLLDYYQPKRIVVDGERNPPPRIYIELAHARNIPIDDTWHSTLIPKNQKLDALGGDPRSNSLVTRSLTWGSAHEAWLDAVESKQPRIRVGSPLSDRYVKPQAPTSIGKDNALILQYTPNVMDIKGLNASMFSHFIDSARLLKNRGYKNIRLKLHPGPGRLKPIYFERIADYFGLECQILKNEPFEQCVAWADIVIGPVQTGALYETLAAGKPYYAFLLHPHGMHPEYYGSYPIYSTVDEFALGLDRPQAVEAERDLLNAVYSIDDFPSGSKRFWEVIENDMASTERSPESLVNYQKL
ncbi:MAG: hypothetical protein HN705_04130 [Rhodospirillales bacterium]|nr:hypothetical protein [Rhodospirillales bacterium]